LRAAVAEHALTSQQRPESANHAKPEVTSDALPNDRKQRNTGTALHQLNVADFRTTTTNAGLVLIFDRQTCVVDLEFT